MSDEILYESAGGIARIILNRPEKRNAINESMAVGLYEAWKRFQFGEDRVAVIMANGTDFSVGADIKSPPQNFPLSIPGIGVEVTKPVIASINGWCTGGAVVLVQLCDLCVASTTAKFLYPEAKRGFTGGMIAGIANRIPHKIAMELMLLGDALPSDRAYQVGLVNKVVESSELDAASMEYAERLAARAPLVLTQLKKMAGELLLLGPAEKAAKLRHTLTEIRQSADAKEGIASFIEKRAPSFSGKLD